MGSLYPSFFFIVLFEKHAVVFFLETPRCVFLETPRCVFLETPSCEKSMQITDGSRIGKFRADPIMDFNIEVLSVQIWLVEHRVKVIFHAVPFHSGI